MAAVAWVFATVVVAQTPTLPEQVGAAQSDVTLNSGVDGPILLFEDVLAQTDVVVRARIGSLISYLSEDRRGIYTTYQLINPAVLYAAKVVQSSTPGVAPPRYGVFEVRESKIVPLVPGNGPHQAFAGMDANSFIADVVARRRRLSTN